MTGQQFDRRRFLRGLGLGAAALGSGQLLAACGGGSSGLSGDQGGGASQGASGAKPTLNAVVPPVRRERHPAGGRALRQGVPGRHVTVQWNPGDYTSSWPVACCPTAVPTSSSSTPHDRHGQGRPGRRPGRHHRRTRSPTSPAASQRIDLRGQALRGPEVTDMQLLVYRKSLLTRPGGQAARPPSTSSSPPPRSSRPTRPRASSSATTAASPCSAAVLLASWAAGQDYLTADNQDGLRRQPRRRGARQLRELCSPATPAARRADRLVGPVRVHPGPGRHAVVGSLGSARHRRRRSPDDFGVMAWPALAPGGSRPCRSALRVPASARRPATSTPRRAREVALDRPAPRTRRTSRSASASTSRPGKSSRPRRTS